MRKLLQVCLLKVYKKSKCSETHEFQTEAYCAVYVSSCSLVQWSIFYNYIFPQGPDPLSQTPGDSLSEIQKKEADLGIRPARFWAQEMEGSTDEYTFSAVKPSPPSTSNS